MKKLLWIALVALLLWLLYCLFCRVGTGTIDAPPEVVPFRYIVDYNGMTPEDSTDLVKRYEALSGKVISSCDCDKLELWDFSDFPVVSGENVVVIKDTLGPDTHSYLAHDIYLSQKTPSVSNVCKDNFAPRLVNLPNPIVTAVLDSGIDFENRQLRAGVWSNPQNCGEGVPLGLNMIDLTKIPQDSLGHGTHVAGLAYLQNANHKLMPIKVLNKEGEGTLFNAICGMHFAINNDAQIINCSMGYRGEVNSVFENVVKKAEDNKVFIVCSAGNEGINLDTLPSGGHWPGSFENPNIINVAAVGKDSTTGEWKLADFSNFDKNSVDIAAPGVGVKSAALRSDTTTNAAVQSGTSMATAIVTQRLSQHMAKFPANAPLNEISFQFENEHLVDNADLTNKTTTGKMLKVDFIDPLCQDYCFPGMELTGANFIDGVSIGGFSNEESGTCGGRTYTDFSWLSIPLEVGGTYPFTVKAPSKPCTGIPYTQTSFIAWIDYNSDYEFEDTEIIVRGTLNAYGDTFSDPITVAIPDSLGAKRLRIRSWEGNLQNPLDACSFGSSGETEDYSVYLSKSTINIGGPPNIISDQ